MDFLTAVNKTLTACSEATVTSVTVAPSAQTQKFAGFISEAYREANMLKRWPWQKGVTTVTAGLSANTFVPAANLLEIVSVSYSGYPLSDRYTFEELQQILPQLGAQQGRPTHFAMQDFNTIFVYPAPTEVAPETLVQVYGYQDIPDLVADTDVLAGPAAYHDAVVQLAYAIAKDKHFGSVSEAAPARALAIKMLRTVFARARRNKAAPRIRV